MIIDHAPMSLRADTTTTVHSADSLLMAKNTYHLGGYLRSTWYYQARLAARTLAMYRDLFFQKTLGINSMIHLLTQCVTNNTVIQSLIILDYPYIGCKFCVTVEHDFQWWLPVVHCGVWWSYMNMIQAVHKNMHGHIYNMMHTRHGHW